MPAPILQQNLGARSSTSGIEMQWVVEFDGEFAPEFRGFSKVVQDVIFALLIKLRRFGPQLGRDDVDTLKGSRYSNMKELRFKAGGGVWHLPLTRRDLQFCLWPGISQG